jgi:hypothetical protein
VLRRLQPQLAATQKIYGMVERRKVDKTIIAQTIAEICKFVTNQCFHVEEKFFYDESELATEEKYVKLRNWRTDLDMNDYKLPDLF